MLTATAYSIVIADGLPKLGYLTWLDEYILITFALIALVAVEVAVLFWGDAVDDTAEVQKYVTYANVALWVVVHAGLAGYVRFWVLPAESKKGEQLQEQLQGRRASVSSLAPASPAKPGKVSAAGLY